MNVALEHFDFRAGTLDASGPDVALNAGAAPELDRAVEGWWMKTQLDRGTLESAIP